MSNVNILIIEDEAVVAHDIARRVSKMGYDVSGIKHSSEEAFNYLQIHSCDLILCDINIDGAKDGIDIATSVLHNKRTPLIFVTALADMDTLDRAKKTLPYGYIVKPFDNYDLRAAIEIALYKHSVELDKLAISLEKVNSLALEDVSSREFEMLTDIMKGRTNDQISAARHISKATVKFHIRNLLRKIGATNRADALHKIIKILTNQQ